MRTARPDTIRQAIEITEREIRDPIGHWGIGKHGLANRFGMDTSDATADELETLAMSRLATLRALLRKGK